MVLSPGQVHTMHGMTRPLVSFLTVAIMLLAGAVILRPNADGDAWLPASISVTPTDVSRTVLDVPFSNLTQVNDTIFEGTWATTPPNCQAHNLSVGYDDARDCANLSATKNCSGGFYLCGFKTALKTSVTLDFKMLSYGFNGLTFSLNSYEFKIGADDENSHFHFFNNWFNATGAVQTWSRGIRGLGGRGDAMDTAPDRLVFEQDLSFRFL